METVKSTFDELKNKMLYDIKKIHPTKKYYWKCTKKPRHRYQCTLSERIRRMEFQENNGCPRCIYYGEEVVCEWLRVHGFQYKREFSFEGTRKRFDIVLLKKNILIEVDGNQHFKGNRKFGSSAIQREKDIHKMNIAMENGYTLIRIKQSDILDRSVFPWGDILGKTIEALEGTTNTIAFIASDMECYTKFYKNV